MNYINIKSIQEKALNSKKLIKSADAIVKKKFESNKNSFLTEFDNHVVTQEISEGSSAPNISKTLNGQGNLFGFIGFNEGDSPIENLRNFLNKNFDFKRKNISNKKISYTIYYPSFEKIKSITKMPWESGRSWVEGIERGISGLSYYLYKKSIASRSGGGIQSENQINISSFKTMKYMTEIINKFKKNFK